MSDLVRAGGFWENTSKNGDVYLKGSFGMANAFLFKNKNKKNEKSPDWFLSFGNKDDEGFKKEEAPTSSDAVSDDVPF